MGFLVYVDESGDEGFRFSSGSSRWFVLSGVIVPVKSELAVMKGIVNEMRSLLKKNGVPDKKLKTLHFKDLRHEQRLPYVHKIAEAEELVTVSVLVDKTQLESPCFKKGHRLYFYAVRLLMERVSWFCSSAVEPEATVVFSNKATMSYDDLRGYFKLLTSKKTEINWDVVAPERMHTLTAGKRMGLMVADAVASSYFYAVEHSAYGYTEDRYVRTLLPLAYSNSGCAKKYGVKLYPGQDYDTLDWLTCQK
ncbi:DUF3800 domain-containing protein [Oceanithermus sp.]